MKSKKAYQGDILHVFNKSIANFKIFNHFSNSQRFINVLDYYNTINRPVTFSAFLRTNPDFYQEHLLYHKNLSLIKFISYSIMPDHYHLVIKILGDNILSKYLGDVENSYSRFFNEKFKRKGPLWQSNFKFVRIKTNEQLLHVTRYVHLNATTSNLVEKPEDWKFSSYRFFISDKKYLDYATEISIRNPLQYKKFVEDQKDYQRKLKRIKKLLFD